MSDQGGFACRGDDAFRNTSRWRRERHGARWGGGGWTEAAGTTSRLAPAGIQGSADYNSGHARSGASRGPSMAHNSTARSNASRARSNHGQAHAVNPQAHANNSQVHANNSQARMNGSQAHLNNTHALANSSQTRVGTSQARSNNSQARLNTTNTGTGKLTTASPLNTSRSASVNTVHPVRTGVSGSAYTYGSGFGPAVTGPTATGGLPEPLLRSTLRLRRSQGNNRAIVSRLRSVHASLARVDHDYQGHRVRAMHAISMAIRQLSHRSMVYSGAGFASGMNNGMGMGHGMGMGMAGQGRGCAERPRRRTRRPGRCRRRSPTPG